MKSHKNQFKKNLNTYFFGNLLIFANSTHKQK